MKKINVSTKSGDVLQKPLITAFKSSGGEYVVLDNEINGTMGLPIILVSKMVNNNLSLIPDAEWNNVKEVLRLIISGNQVDYINVADSIMADDVFFKQLTLPVASFEALKNSYVPAALEQEPVQEGNAALEADTVMQVQDASISPTLSEPVMPSAPIQSQVVAPVMPEVEVAPMPSVEPIPEDAVDTPVDFTADKEAFLKACENMFDALVAKFNNK